MASCRERDVLRLRYAGSPRFDLCYSKSLSASHSAESPPPLLPSSLSSQPGLASLQGTRPFWVGKRAQLKAYLHNIQKPVSSLLSLQLTTIKTLSRSICPAILNGRKVQLLRGLRSRERTFVIILMVCICHIVYHVYRYYRSNSNHSSNDIP
jgi:hypothetical protein